MSCGAPDHLISPAEHRERRRAVVARALRRAMDKHCVRQAELAAACGVPTQRVQQWVDVEADKHIPVADAVAAPEALRVELARLILGDGFVVKRAERTEHTTLADVTREAGRTIATVATSFADGHLTPAEAVDTRAAIAALREHLDRVDRMCSESIAQRGLRVAGGDR